MNTAKPVSGPTAQPTAEVKTELPQPADADQQSINREPKDPNTIGISKRRLGHDGAYREYLLDSAHPGEDHLYQAIRRTLGLSAGDELNLRSDLEKITVLAATYLQTDNHDEVENFIKQLLRKTPHTGTSNSRVYNLRRTVEYLYNDRGNQRYY